ncbi:hypothetical protein EJB05_43355 [Eragrostis curvula]|uniref:Uncharacterized protein n=1 Tax=Eragrostis curvula TaxID=38414 RepID=A0A5J9TFR5_9POAL|nr:hypothetical protein EJB05_43355 [Eragrostis curvula]
MEKMHMQIAVRTCLPDSQLLAKKATIRSINGAKDSSHSGFRRKNTRSSPLDSNHSNEPNHPAWKYAAALGLAW